MLVEGGVYTSWVFKWFYVPGFQAMSLMRCWKISTLQRRWKLDHSCWLLVHHLDGIFTCILWLKLGSFLRLGWFFWEWLVIDDDDDDDDDDDGDYYHYLLLFIMMYYDLLLFWWWWWAIEAVASFFKKWPNFFGPTSTKHDEVQWWVSWDEGCHELLGARVCCQRKCCSGNHGLGDVYFKKSLFGGIIFHTVW